MYVKDTSDLAWFNKHENIPKNQVLVACTIVFFYFVTHWIHSIRATVSGSQNSRKFSRFFSSAGSDYKKKDNIVYIMSIGQRDRQKEMHKRPPFIRKVGSIEGFEIGLCFKNSRDISGLTLNKTAAMNNVVRMCRQTSTYQNNKSKF